MSTRITTAGHNRSARIRRLAGTALGGHRFHRPSAGGDDPDRALRPAAASTQAGALKLTPSIPIPRLGPTRR
jgi:hypothetical protein